jgi:hypothetical protein
MCPFCRSETVLKRFGLTLQLVCTNLTCGAWGPARSTDLLSRAAMATLKIGGARQSQACPFCGAAIREFTAMAGADRVFWVACTNYECRCIGPRRPSASEAQSVWDRLRVN